MKETVTEYHFIDTFKKSDNYKNNLKKALTHICHQASCDPNLLMKLWYTYCDEKKNHRIKSFCVAKNHFKTILRCNLTYHNIASMKQNHVNFR